VRAVEAICNTIVAANLARQFGADNYIAEDLNVPAIGLHGFGRGDTGPEYAVYLIASLDDRISKPVEGSG
jgi:hypothetical protein